MYIPIASLSTFFHAYHSSDPFGKLIFWGLFVLSCITWVILLQKYFSFRTIRRSTEEFEQAIYRKKENLLNISKEQLPTSAPHPFAKLFFALKQKTIEILEKNHKYGQREDSSIYLSSSDMELVESHLSTLISRELKNLEKNLFILSTIVSLAPFLGLLGTVWGILISFAQLQSGVSAQSSQVILGGLSTALTTTVLGLVIAIPALIGHNYLKNCVKSFLSDMDHFSYQLLATIELQYRRIDAS